MSKDISNTNDWMELDAVSDEDCTSPHPTPPQTDIRAGGAVSRPYWGCRGRGRGGRRGIGCRGQSAVLGGPQTGVDRCLAGHGCCGCDLLQPSGVSDGRSSRQSLRGMDCGQLEMNNFHEDT